MSHLGHRSQPSPSHLGAVQQRCLPGDPCLSLNTSFYFYLLTILTLFSHCTNSFQLLLLLLCSHSPNDVPPEPQRNVSIAAVRSAVRPSKTHFNPLSYAFISLTAPFLSTWFTGTRLTPSPPPLGGYDVQEERYLIHLMGI